MPTAKYAPATTRLLSGNLWAGCPVAQLKNHELDGIFHFCDFENAPTMSPASNLGLYASYIDTGDTIKQLTGVTGGVLELLTAATDNNETWLTSGGNTGPMCGISDVPAATFNSKLWFEARFKVQNVADSQKNIFVGLSAVARAVADTITDGGVLGAFTFVGFNQAEAAGATCSAVWQLAGQALQTKFTATTLVADTFVKLGFRYDPDAPPAKRLTYYTNNVEQSTYGTSTTLQAGTFPANIPLALLMGIKNGAAAAHKLQIDWVGCAQL